MGTQTEALGKIILLIVVLVLVAVFLWMYISGNMTDAYGRFVTYGLQLK